MKGLVYKSTGSWYLIRDEEGRTWNGRIKGVMKLDGITSTNPIAVGDEVDFEPEEEGGAKAMIHTIRDRRNYINRQSPRARHGHHIVAANLDAAVILATLREPRTSSGFIDRFLVACELYHVPAYILFNKLDVYREKDIDLLADWQAMYEEAGYKVAALSLKTGFGMEEVKGLLHGKTTLVSGHSGVGKSTFINALVGGRIRTQDVSGWSGKGQHTTTFAEMYDLVGGGRIIDTPGVREFGLVHVEREELSGYFPEMRRRLAGCQFNNCLHLNEPDCAIKTAVMEGEIAEERYISYCTILDSIEKPWG